MENEWPPFRTCPQYKLCMIRGYVEGKYPWEDDEGNWFKTYKRPGRVGVETMRKEFGIANKFLHQVRTTRTGKAYKLVKIENVVKYPENMMWLLTILAKKRNSVPETFLSMVCQMPDDEGVVECLLKPDGQADWGADEEKFLHKIREHTDEDTDDVVYN